MRGLRRILNITWQGNVPHNTALKRAEILSLYTPLRQRLLRWLGHVVRMDDGRIPKDPLYGELAPLAGHNYALKMVATGTWRPWALTSTFRLEASSAVRLLESEDTLAEQANTNRQTRKARIQGDRPATDQICSLWGRDCLSRMVFPGTQGAAQEPPVRARHHSLSRLKDANEWWMKNYASTIHESPAAKAWPTLKPGLHFHTFRLFWTFSTRTTRKVVFYFQEDFLVTSFKS